MTEEQEILHTDNFRELIKSLGENPERDGLKKTPQRYIQSMRFLTSGYRADIGKLINKALFDVEYDDMVIVRDIEFYSLCEHHMLPFFGRCHIGYIPQGKVLGLSKFARIVDVFARRLQVQEQLTHQISAALQEHLNPRGTGVVIEAQHMCMMMRGVEKQGGLTITSAMTGCMRDNLETRQEFLAHVRKHS